MQQQPEVFFRRNGVLPYVEMRSARYFSACYDTHSHPEFSFGVVDGGYGHYVNKDREMLTQRGSTVLINPDEPHSCNPAQAPTWSYRMLFVDTAWMADLQRSMLGAFSGEFVPFARPMVDDPATYQHFDQLFCALLNEDDAMAAEEVLIGFIQQQFQPLLASEPRFDSGQMKQAKAVILDRLQDNLSIDELAAEVGLSPYHLIRSFRAAYGQTPHAFLLDQRINRAKPLLQQGQAIADVAQALGFADQSHFQRHFKRRIAITPRQYQACFIRG